MITYIYCPRCHAMQFSTIYDYEHELLIFKCERCGEMYSVSYDDYWNIGLDEIFREWHRGYMKEPKALK